MLKTGGGYALALALAVAGACGGNSKDIEPAAEPEATTPQAHLVGDWCMQGQAMDLKDKLIADGSKWTFDADGSYDYLHKWYRQSGTWTLSGAVLEISDVGTHEVVELGPDKMVLKRGVYQVFGRDCGPEYAKAEKVARLVAAASEGSVEKVKEQLADGADIDGLDELGLLEQSALMAAARRDHGEVVELLLVRGAKRDLVDSVGDTAFKIAEREGREQAIKVLLRFGARPSPRPEPAGDAPAPADVARAVDPNDPGRLSIPANETGTSTLVADDEAEDYRPAQRAKAAAPAFDEAKFKQAFCEGRKQAIEKARRGELDEMARIQGVDRDGYIARMQELYDSECR